MQKKAGTSILGVWFTVGLPEISGPFLGFAIIRSMLFGDQSWGPLFSKTTRLLWVGVDGSRSKRLHRHSGFRV